MFFHILHKTQHVWLCRVVGYPIIASGTRTQISVRVPEIHVVYFGKMEISLNSSNCAFKIILNQFSSSFCQQIRSNMTIRCFLYNIISYIKYPTRHSPTSTITDVYVKIVVNTKQLMSTSTLTFGEIQNVLADGACLDVLNWGYCQSTSHHIKRCAIILTKII